MYHIKNKALKEYLIGFNKNDLSRYYVWTNTIDLSAGYSTLLAARNDLYELQDHLLRTMVLTKNDQRIDDHATVLEAYVFSNYYIIGGA